MAESGLSIGLPDLQSAVGYYLGYGSTVANFTASQLLEVTNLVQSGVRRVYYPPAATAQTVGYEWSWLRPSETLQLTAGQWEYPLPDNFGRLIGTLHYPASTYVPPISIVSESKLLDMRAHSDLVESPRYAATRYLVSTGAIGSRQEILFFPTPGRSPLLSYDYEAYCGSLTDALPYPLGGMQVAEVYIESCLALAESRINDELGIHAAQFQTLLIDAISRDRKRGAQNHGRMGHNENEWFDRDWGVPPFPIYYNGEIIT